MNEKTYNGPICGMVEVAPKKTEYTIEIPPLTAQEIWWIREFIQEKIRARG